MNKDALLLIGAGGLAYAAFMAARSGAKEQSEYDVGSNPARTAQDVDVLARTIWGEARGEGTRGMQAVANVVMNRVAKQTWYGKTVVEVCTKKGQFTAWKKGDPNYEPAHAVTTNNPAFAQALQIAARAVAGTLPDITGGADHYFNPDVVLPSWAQTMSHLIDIGRHAFYRA